MKTNTTADIVIMFLLMTFIGLCFMAFMHRFEKKKYFSAGTYLAGIVTFCTVLANFIIQSINNN